MKRSTWYVVGTFAVLLAAYAAMSWRPKADTPPPLSIDGYIGNLSEQDARSQAKDTPPPVKRIVIRRKDEEITLDRLPPASKDKPEAVTELKWTAKRVAHGKTTETKAQGFRAQSMSETLMRSIRSSHTRKVSAAELKDYGLDADHRIEVEWTLDNRTVKIRLGLLQKPEEGDPSTWVQAAGVDDVVYQVAARDLRTSFDVTWSDLRDRSVLSLKLEDVDRIEIENPADAKAKKVVAQRPGLSDVQRKELADKKQERDANEGWALQEPAGVVTGDIGDWLKAIDRFSVSEFIDSATVADKKLDTGLDDPATRVVVTVTAGKDKTVIVFGRTDAERPNKEAYARIEGRDELYLVASYTKDQIVQTLDQLRDRRLLGARHGKDATAFKLTSGAMRLDGTRGPAGWTLAGAEVRPSAAAIDTFLGDLDALKVDFAAPEAPTATGLDAPGATAEFQFGGETVRFDLGKEVDGNTWGRSFAGGQPGDTFKLSSWNAGKLKKTGADLADKHLIEVARDDIAELWLTPPAAADAVHLVRDVTGSGWSGDGGGKRGKIKEDAANDLIRAVADAEWSAVHADKAPASVGLDGGHFSVKVRTRAGKEAEIRLSEQKAGEDPYVVAVVAGKMDKVAAIGSWAAGNLRKVAKDFFE
ncbi:MAG: DUF4340 domain-containing protein [Myxococcales bacterium]|nr:DUF4340 domain-containing protein [Myxococcales bacterium]